MVSIFTASQGWAMEEERRLEGSPPFGRKRSTFNSNTAENTPAYEQLLALISKNKQEDLTDVAIRLAKELLPKNTSIAKLSEHMNKLGEDSRKENFLIIGLPLLGVATPTFPFVKYEQTIRAIPKSQKPEFLNNIVRVMRGIKSDAQRMTLLGDINDISRSKRTELLKIVAPLLTELPFDEALTIFWQLQRLPANERLDYRDRIVPAMRRLPGFDTSKVFSVIKKLPLGERVEFLTLLEPLVGRFSDSEITMILRELTSISANNRLEYIEKIMPQVREVSSFKNTSIEHALVFSEIESLPENERLDVLKKVLLLREDVRICPKLICLLHMISSDFRIQMVDLIKTASKEDPETFNAALEALPQNEVPILSFVFANSPTLKEATIKEWSSVLSSPDEDKAERLSDFIIENFINFGFSDIDEIYQEALRVRILLESSTDPKNPYNLHKRVLEKRQEHVDLGSLHMVREIIEGQDLSLNPFYFKSLSQKTLREIPIETLPDLTHTFLEDMVAHFEKRLTGNTALPDEIISRFGIPFSSLMAGSLGSQYLKNYLNLEGLKSVSLKAAKFIAILAYVESLDEKKEGGKGKEKEKEETVSQGSELSATEDAFLRMLSNIAECTTGKDEGIHFSYSYLEDKHKLKAVTIEQDPLQNFIDRILTTSVEGMLSGTNNLMKELIGMKPTEEVQRVVENEVIQAVHQTRFLKNTIGQEIGLGDTVEFDNYSQLLYQDLIDRSKYEMMQSFYRHFRPLMVIDALEKGINKVLKEKDSDITFMTLSENIPEGQRKEAFDFDTETEEISMTTVGVISLLKHFGVLQQ